MTEGGVKFAIIFAAFSALSACGTNRLDPADYPNVETPTPVMSQSAFISAFEEICLRPPAALSSFKAAARNLGLKQVRASNQDGNSYYLWEAPKQNGFSPLVLSLATGGIIYEVVGSASGLPIRKRECSLEATLAPDNKDSLISLKEATRGRLRGKAKTIDFSAIKQNGSISSDDIEVRLKEPGTVFRITTNSATDPVDRKQFSYRSPAKLTLEVVLERIP